MRGVIAAAVLGAAVLLAAPAVRRLQRRAAVERALSRDIQEGMQLAEVTEILRRRKVEFAVDSAARGAAVVTVGRDVARRGRVTTVTEQQLLFDSQQRLLDMRTVAHVRSR